MSGVCDWPSVMTVTSSICVRHQLRCGCQKTGHTSKIHVQQTESLNLQHSFRALLFTSRKINKSKNSIIFLITWTSIAWEGYFMQSSQLVPFAAILFLFAADTSYDLPALSEHVHVELRENCKKQHHWHSSENMTHFSTRKRWRKFLMAKFL